MVAEEKEATAKALPVRRVVRLHRKERKQT